MSYPVSSFPRRTLLAGAAGLAAATGVGLTGCGSSKATPHNDAAANGSVELPTYVPYEGAKPDLAASEDGVEAGFYSYPSDRPTSVPRKPGADSNKKITAMANIYFPIPAAPNKNSWWAGLNDRLGVELDVAMVPANDYTAKFATTIATNDLPDMLQMQVVANYPQLLDKKFTALDEYLSGDAVKKYPNLANIPTLTWKHAVYNGHIYGIPIPRGRVAGYDFIRPDIFAQRKVQTDITGGWDEFLDSMKALTSAKDRTWALARGQSALGMMTRMNECANNWLEIDGSLTSVYETDNYKQAVEDTAALWKAGVMHPDAFSSTQPWKQLFSAGTVSINSDGYLAWPAFVLSNKNDPSFKQAMMTFSTRDGSKPAPWNPGTGVYGFSTGPAINAFAKGADPERIELLLRVCDYLAAPFGTEEHHYLSFGDAGVHHEVDGGEPVLTDKGVSDIQLPLQYLAGPPHALYQPGRPRDVDVQHAYMSKVLPLSTVDPTLGLFSDTAATKSASASLTLADDVNSIIVGRKPPAELEAAVRKWKSAAGDAMRDEFTEQLQTQGGPTNRPS